MAGRVSHGEAQEMFALRVAAAYGRAAPNLARNVLCNVLELPTVGAGAGNSLSEKAAHSQRGGQARGWQRQTCLSCGAMACVNPTLSIVRVRRNKRGQPHLTCRVCGALWHSYDRHTMQGLRRTNAANAAKALQAAASHPSTTRTVAPSKTTPSAQAGSSVTAPGKKDKPGKANKARKQRAKLNKALQQAAGQSKGGGALHDFLANLS
ncbi:uncharacterized protein MONBRDRAFT_7543 [Monosiga brevicollis MX1]|uniref:Uncharacterized protein n=1 Tax=Monosiga brevicollis TaxID=81824 RepID=A9UXB1_MONBE|nr:uncharacterized protein MONBRDRAFT_7543 [Monosiga brevicollis MX1]EDQ90187.1 predicted protein [Monosiga brevicollis MX1]|eukprot:XP_001744954.1 hypothetical protein [Monosiga brevicollis MX1]